MELGVGEEPAGALHAMVHERVGIGAHLAESLVALALLGRGQLLGGVLDRGRGHHAPVRVRMRLGDVAEHLVRLEVVAARLRVDALEVLPVLDDVRAGHVTHRLRLVHVHAPLVVYLHRHRLARGGVDHHLL